MRAVFPVPKLPLMRIPWVSVVDMVLESSRSNQWRPIYNGSGSWSGTSKKRGLRVSWAGRYCGKRSCGSSLSGADRAERRIWDLRCLKRPRSSIGPCCAAGKIESKN